MATQTVNIHDMSFDPDPVTIQPGDTVQWVWQEDNHSTTADDGSWDSGVHRQPFTFSHTFGAAGDNPYYCRIHGGPGGTGMSGVVQVRAADAS
jgi:plastocyanin